MLEFNSLTLDVTKIADSGQTFRMDTNRVIAGSRIAYFDENRIICPDCDNDFWSNYFDLSTDYEALIDSIDPEDAYLKTASEFGRGIRILRQDPWEMLITFIISQRKNIPAIKSCVEAICRRWGEEIEPGINGFPSPQALSCATMEELSACSLGYRAEYVYLAAKAVALGLDLAALDRFTDQELLAELMKLKGVGIKVANCVSLFGYHRIGAFPIDVWIDRILKENYPNGFDFERYSGYAGVMQQYMFYYGRSVK